MKQNKVNTILLMDYIGNDSIANVILKEVPESLKEKTLAESGLKTEHNILIMLIERDGIKPGLMPFEGTYFEVQYGNSEPTLHFCRPNAHITVCILRPDLYDHTVQSV